jgi:CheY-like chemotaxis protein
MDPARIVLIEDNPADVLLVRMALDENGIRHQLMQFDSGADAVRELCGPGRKNSDAPDAIFVDLNTPRSDGFEVLRQLGQTPELRGVPIAVLTSSRASSDKRRVAALKTRYIEKPSRLADFLSSVSEAAKEMLRQRQEWLGTAVRSATAEKRKPSI